MEEGVEVPKGNKGGHVSLTFGFPVTSQSFFAFDAVVQTPPTCEHVDDEQARQHIGPSEEKIYIRQKSVLVHFLETLGLGYLNSSSMSWIAMFLQTEKPMMQTMKDNPTYMAAYDTPQQ
ncbi:hypothetical protein KC19_VG022400 [Ceratodon purpureus]|uniref:Uncharacterized protein n=1 Tax=Ceratodon purpureus TaxID=3225 RepID=A0A8T0HLE7_CERPU|nr:hypothetical protein KC19_VG022400 [Ceratodon purpureus]